MNDQAFAGLRDETTEIASSTPAEGDHVTANTVFDVQWEEPALVAQDTTYTLDGEPIAIGDEFGVGLTSGEHVIGVEGKTVFGQPISETIAFTSGSIPETGGTDTAQGQGTVTLSARAINPDGGDVTSTFYAGETDIAQDGFQGLTHEIPTTLEFEYEDGAEIDGSGESLSAGQDQVAFQRFDVAVGDAVEGQTVRWAGSVDPSREVTLMVWNTASESWDAVAAGRGLTEGELVLSGELAGDHLNADGAASGLVVAEDPFSDDLASEVADSFEDPEDYDFAIAHLTDTQYLAEGAAEDAYSEEQQAIWAQSYTDTID